MSAGVAVGLAVGVSVELHISMSSDVPVVMFVGISVGLSVGRSLGDAVCASVYVSMSERGFAVGALVKIAGDIAVNSATAIWLLEIGRACAMGFYDASLLAAAFRGIR